jgi:hypothetical protein
LRDSSSEDDIGLQQSEIKETLKASDLNQPTFYSISDEQTFRAEREQMAIKILQERYGNIEII